MTLKTPLENWIQRIISKENDPVPLTRSSLEAYQLQKLRETLFYTRENSPFYRHLLRDAGTDSVRRIEDMARLPFTTSEDLKKYSLRFLCVSQSSIERCVTLQSSGTTGPAKRVFFTREDLEHTLDFFHHGMSTLVNPGDRVMILLPGGGRPDSVSDLLSRALARMDVQSLAPGPDPQNTPDAVIGQGITCLVGAPVHVLALARCGHGENCLKNRIKSVLLTADNIPSAIVDAVESAFNCKVYRHYGMTEMGWGGGVECDARDGYHLREADLFLEIIDPETGRPLPDGESGEVVVTTLTRVGMPLIRYRTGDISRFHTSPCSCGTVLKRLDRITGRMTDDDCLVSGMSLTLPVLDEALFPLPGVMDFRAGLASCRNGDSLTVTLGLSGDADPDAVAAAAREKLAAIHAIRTSRIQLVIELPQPGSSGLLTPGNRKRTLEDNRPKSTRRYSD
ncbi:MAG: phenylacetate--CoA ligase family protein [Desulfobacteraceae bacterium]|nr:MAG: phenylacetate--CoA ligase family protein [Desulfobacteraceae bacterium]